MPAAEALPVAPSQPVSAEAAFNHRGFAYSSELRSENGKFRIYRLCYPSPVVTTSPPNNTVPVDYYLPRAIATGDKPRPAVICLHILHGNFELEHLCCAMLASRGIPAAMVKLPYYGERAAAGDRQRLAADPDMLTASLSQGVEDVRRLVDLLASRPEVDARRIGVIGISMGGITAATVAGQEPRIWRTSLVLAGGSLLEIIHHARETRQWSELIRQLPAAPRKAMEAAIEQADPLHWAAGLRDRAEQGRVLMINAGADEVIPRACTEKLAEALGMPKRVQWLEGLGHYTAIAALPESLRTAAEFFAADLPTEAPAPAAKSPPRSPLALVTNMIQQAIKIATSEPAAGRCHLIDVDLNVTLKDGKTTTGRLRYVRGSGMKFALEAAVPTFGQASVGQNDRPWMAANKGSVFVGALPAGEKAGNPLMYVEPRNLAKLQMAGGVLGAALLVPETLERWITIADSTTGKGTAQGAAGETSVRIANKQRPQDHVLIVMRDDRTTPGRVEFDIAGVKGTATVRAWQLDGIAADSLFEPPTDRAVTKVEAADLYRMFSGAVNFALEAL